MLKEFKEFISRGSVLDLAVGVIIGGAFTSIVTAFVDGLITPLIGLVIKLLTNKQDLEEAAKGMVFTVKGIDFNYGSVITAIITFLITAFVLFMIIKTVNKANDIVKREEAIEEAEEPAITSEDLLAEIRDLLKAEAAQTETEDKK